jgi:hypothetical protein
VSPLRRQSCHSVGFGLHSDGVVAAGNLSNRYTEVGEEEEQPAAIEGAPAGEESEPLRGHSPSGSTDSFEDIGKEVRPPSPLLYQKEKKIPVDTKE